MAIKDKLTVEFSPGTGTLRAVPGSRRRSTGAAATASRQRRNARAAAKGEAKDDEPAGVIDLLIAAGSLVSATEVLRQLQEALGVADRLRAISNRFGSGVEETLTALSDLAARTPTASSDPTSSLTEVEESVLREAGSLATPMPSLSERPSAQTAVAAIRLLETALTVKDAARKLDVSDGRVRQRVAERTLVGVETSSGWKLPAFQFTDDGDVRGLDRVLPVLPDDVHPLVVYRFLTQPTAELLLDDEPTSPREWLTTGGSVERVVTLAEQLHSLP
jgi:hypothetical protein